MSNLQFFLLCFAILAARELRLRPKSALLVVVGWAVVLAIVDAVQQA